MQDAACVGADGAAAQGLLSEGAYRPSTSLLLGVCVCEFRVGTMQNIMHLLPG